MRDERKREISEALEKATPGPWIADVHQCGSEIMQDSSDVWGWVCQLWYKDEEPMPNFKANAHLIANAPTWIRQQQEYIQQLESKIEQHNKVIELFSHWKDFYAEKSFDAEYKVLENVLAELKGAREQ